MSTPTAWERLRNTSLPWPGVPGKGPILFAIPSIENAYDETCKIVAIDTPHLIEEEAEWLKFAFANMPSLLVKEADVLVVDEIQRGNWLTGCVRPKRTVWWIILFTALFLPAISLLSIDAL